MAIKWTPEELAEMAAADAEIDAEECCVDRALSAELDRYAKYDRLDNRARRTVVRQRAYKREYRQKNKDAVAAYKREYRQKNKDAVAAYQREYRQRRKKRATDSPE